MRKSDHRMRTAGAQTGYIFLNNRVARPLAQAFDQLMLHCRNTAWPILEGSRNLTHAFCVSFAVAAAS